MQNELPEWAKMKAFEVQSAAIKECQDNRLFVIADYPFVTGAAKEVLDKHLAQALVDTYQRGRRYGMEEATKAASPNHGPGIFSEYENGRRDAAKAIRQLGETT